MRRELIEVYEAAFVLELSERDVRNMLRRGSLTAGWAGRRRLAHATELRERLQSRPLSLLILERIATGRLDAPRALNPTDRAPALRTALRELAASRHGMRAKCRAIGAQRSRESIGNGSYPVSDSPSAPAPQAKRRKNVRER